MVAALDFSRHKSLASIAIREYLDAQGFSPFADWFEELNAAAAAKVATALARIEQGNFSSVKGVGAGVYESRIDSGPGYRVYLGKDGETIVILKFGWGKSCSSRRQAPHGGRV